MEEKEGERKKRREAKKQQGAQGQPRSNRQGLANMQDHAQKKCLLGKILHSDVGYKEHRPKLSVLADKEQEPSHIRSWNGGYGNQTAIGSKQLPATWLITNYLLPIWIVSQPLKALSITVYHNFLGFLTQTFVLFNLSSFQTII